MIVGTWNKRGGGCHTPPHGRPDECGDRNLTRRPERYGQWAVE
jgi:hypothetical protein